MEKQNTQATEPVQASQEEENRGFYQLEENPELQDVERLLDSDEVRAEGSFFERLILRILNNIKAAYKKAESMAANIGKPGGVATLDENGKIPLDQFPGAGPSGLAGLDDEGKIPMELLYTLEGNGGGDNLPTTVVTYNDAGYIDTQGGGITTSGGKVVVGELVADHLNVATRIVAEEDITSFGDIMADRKIITNGYISASGKIESDSSVIAPEIELDPNNPVGIITNGGTINTGNIDGVNGGDIETAGGDIQTRGGSIGTDGGGISTRGGKISTTNDIVGIKGGNIETGGGIIDTGGGKVDTGTGAVMTQTLGVRGNANFMGNIGLIGGSGEINTNGGSINTRGGAIIGLPAPANNADAANKEYVDGKIIFGAYTGNGETSRDITIGVNLKAVIVETSTGCRAEFSGSQFDIGGGLALKDHFLRGAGNGRIFARIYNNIYIRVSYDLNILGTTYYYIAFV